MKGQKPNIDFAFLLMCLLTGFILNIFWSATSETVNTVITRTKNESQLLIDSTSGIITRPAFAAANRIGAWRDSGKKSLTGDRAKKIIFFTGTAAQMSILRIAQMVAYLPTVFVFFLLAATDGWVARRRRVSRFNLDAVGTQYVFWRRMVMVPFAIAVAFSLFWPNSLNLGAIILPASALSALMLRQALILYK